MADEHDREMADMGLRVEGESVIHETEEGRIIRVDVSPLRIQAVQGHLADVMEKSVIPLEPMFIEVLIALANLSCATANLWLRECDEITVFQANRDTVLSLLNRMAESVARIPFVALGDVPAESDAVN